jgi:hypothetical protein
MLFGNEQNSPEKSYCWYIKITKVLSSCLKYSFLPMWTGFYKNYGRFGRYRYRYRYLFPTFFLHSAAVGERLARRRCNCHWWRPWDRLGDCKVGTGTVTDIWLGLVFYVAIVTDGGHGIGLEIARYRYRYWYLVRFSFYVAIVTGGGHGIGL